VGLLTGTHTNITAVIEKVRKGERGRKYAHKNKWRENIAHKNITKHWVIMKKTMPL